MYELLHQAVTAVAQERPDAVAFRCGNESLTYAELDQRSNQFANALIEVGANKGDRIGVFMPRSVQSCVAIYGIFKAGCIFVALDPNLSSGGLKTLISNCEISQLVTHPKQSRMVVPMLKAGGNALSCLRTVIGLENSEESEAGSTAREWLPWNRLESFSDAQPVVELTGKDPAYIMYSSGSTGSPKGITHTHFSGLSYCRLSIKTYGVNASDVIANHSPINFDMSTFGYFTSIVAGATTVIVPEAHTKFPKSLAKLIADTKITIWYSVPLALIQLLTRGCLDEFDLSAVRWVKYGGEPFPPKYLPKLQEHMPNAVVSNVYGPAEVNQCTYYHVPADYFENHGDAAIPIGAIWDDSKGLVIDGDGQPVNEGEIGELAVCSPTRMMGYWGRKEQTDHSLIERADHKGKMGTYYKTGDLVKFQDGLLHFVGRKDRQVKVRGYRVELDEVESALNGLDQVEEAGVFWVEVDHAKQIQATAILREDAKVEPDFIKGRLGERLSWYSIPSTISLVRELPRTTSGKIDRKQLKIDAEGQLANGIR